MRQEEMAEDAVVLHRSISSAVWEKEIQPFRDFVEMLTSKDERDDIDRVRAQLAATGVPRQVPPMTGLEGEGWEEMKRDGE